MRLLLEPRRGGGVLRGAERPDRRSRGSTRQEPHSRAGQVAGEADPREGAQKGDRAPRSRPIDGREVRTSDEARREAAPGAAGIATRRDRRVHRRSRQREEHPRPPRARAGPRAGNRRPRGSRGASGLPRDGPDGVDRAPSASLHQVRSPAPALPSTDRVPAPASALRRVSPSRLEAVSSRARVDPRREPRGARPRASAGWSGGSAAS